MHDRHLKTQATFSAGYSAGIIQGITIAAGRSILRSAAFAVLCWYRYTMPICAALYGLAMRSDMHGQNKAAPNCSGAVEILESKIKVVF